MKLFFILFFITYVFSQNVVTWGLNDSGQLGVGTRIALGSQTSIAVVTNNFTTAVDSQGNTLKSVALLVTAGRYHTVLYAQDGNLYAFGKNNVGQLGNGNTVQQLSPVRVLYNTTNIPVQFLSAGLSDFTIIVTRDPTTGLQNVQSWGHFFNGYLGTGLYGNYGTPQSIPINVKTNNFQGEVITGLSTGEQHTLLITLSGKIFAWGDNTYGQLGDGTTTQKSEATAVVLSGLGSRTAVSVSTRGNHNLLIANDGSVFAWGNNNQGQVGDGTFVNKLQPTLISGILSGKYSTSVAAGYDHSIVWTSEGKAYGFGTNNYGQCGNRSTLSPIGNGPVESIAINQFLNSNGDSPLKTVCGYQYTLILTSSRRIAVFGRNDQGQLGEGSTNTIALGNYARNDFLTGLYNHYISDLATGAYHTVVIASSCTSITLSVFAMILFYLL